MEEQQNSPMGILIVNKHAGVTSSHIVVRLRRLYGTKQVGHTGTLDPMATGVLPVLIGRAVKASDFLTAEKKAYTAELLLGMTTDSEDTTGKILTTSDEIPTEAEVRAVASRFLGEGTQIPPMVSALKVNGQKLVDLARKGIEVERQPRPVTISRLDVTKLDDRRYRLEVACSKGTYIRTLCADIGNALGCGGVMASLIRTQSGPFTLAEAVTLDELEAMTMEERVARLFPIDRFFADAPAVTLTEFFATLIRNGCAIRCTRIGAEYPENTLVRLYRAEEFFALGSVVNAEEGLAVKAVKLFVL